MESSECSTVSNIRTLGSTPAWELSVASCNPLKTLDSSSRRLTNPGIGRISSTTLRTGWPPTEESTKLVKLESFSPLFQVYSHLKVLWNSLPEVPVAFSPSWKSVMSAETRILLPLSAVPFSVNASQTLSTTRFEQLNFRTAEALLV